MGARDHHRVLPRCRPRDSSRSEPWKEPGPHNARLAAAGRSHHAEHAGVAGQASDELVQQLVPAEEVVGVLLSEGTQSSVGVVGRERPHRQDRRFRGWSEGPELAVLKQDALLEPTELRAGIDPQLLRQPAAMGLVEPQGLCLVTLPCKGLHQQLDESVAERMGCHQSVEQRQRLGDAPHSHQGPTREFLGEEMHVVKALRFGVGELLVAKLGQGWPSPHAERILDQVSGRCEIIRHRPIGLSHQLLEAGRVELR